MLEQQDFMKRPWTQFSQTIIESPETVQIESKSQNLLEWKNHPVWLSQSEQNLDFAINMKGVNSLEIHGY